MRSICGTLRGATAVTAPASAGDVRAATETLTGLDTSVPTDALVRFLRMQERIAWHRVEKSPPGQGGRALDCWLGVCDTLDSVLSDL